jgi:2,5-diketo-D-gluconate reductase A
LVVPPCTFFSAASAANTVLAKSCKPVNGLSLIAEIVPFNIEALSIGVSSFSRAHLEEIQQAGLPTPACNQIEVHPNCCQTALIEYCTANGILVVAYSSFAPLSSWRVKEGQRSSKTQQMRDLPSPFSNMAARYGISEARLLLKWAVQQGWPVLPKSSKPERVVDNFDLFSFGDIRKEDIEKLSAMDKGQPLAWPNGDPLLAP